ncbi:MAG TPA: SDR family NAD(P)-dependent oxidoreductase [Streptosporangiaceae bacterium]|nr:SDR family NAD(P)-dependent oxidoreductase [Streptosporangiaceae bacterium]
MTEAPDRGSAKPRRALVTGAGGGIGRAAAARLAAEGASVALLDIREQDLAVTAEQLRQSGADVLELPTDVGDEQQVAAALAAVISRWGGLDAAVAAAGISMSITGDARVDRLELSVWERIIRTNLTGMFLTCKYVVQAMTEAGGGSIVVIGSPTGMYGFAFGEHAYSASKGGCHALARVMAGELAPLGIRVNVVVPGFIDTRMNDHVLADPDTLADAERLIPLARVGQPSEVAGLISWLTSPDASYATGGYYPVDGGQMCL